MTVPQRCLTSMVLIGLVFPMELGAADSLSSGIWVGGFGSLEDDTLSWSSVRLVLESDSGSDALSGKLRTNGSQRYAVSIEQSQTGPLMIQIERRKNRRFNGSLSDGAILATATDGEIPNQLILRKIEPLPTQQLRQLGGIYQTESGERLSIRPAGEGLALINFDSGLVRHLYSVGSDRFVAGPGIAIPSPVVWQFQFRRTASGVADELQIERPGQPARTAVRRPGPRTETFAYDSFDGTKIVGTLLRPLGAGPFPACVWVHGSGRANRYGAGSWPHYFVDLGFAVLAVDKRGVGDSGGKYNLPNGGRDNLPHMRRRSKDVAAAVNALRARPDIRGDRVGLVGASQAGWVIPMATVHTDIQFGVILFGGATPLSVEGEFSRIASENQSGAQLKPVAKLIEELRSYQPTDVGIEAELAAMKFPCLWVYGFRDRSNPSQLCVELIERIGAAHQSDFAIQTFPDGNHGMLECRFGGSAEARTLSRLVPGLHAGIEDWLIDQKLTVR